MSFNGIPSNYEEKASYINWKHEISSTTRSIPNNGYICNNVSQVVVYLPLCSKVGDMIGVVGKGAGGWKLQGNGGQTIHHGQLSTIEGGSIQSSYFKATCVIMCITANTDWSVIWTNNEIEVEVS